MKRANSQTFAIIASLALHALVAALAWSVPMASEKLARHKTSAEVELIDPAELMKMIERERLAATKGQIVEQDQKRINDEVPKDARFLGRHNQTVIEETQAANRGAYRNSVTMGGTPSPQKVTGSDAQKKEDAKDRALLANGDTPVSHRSLRDLTPSFKPAVPRPESDAAALGGGDAASATNDHLKNVATGMQTLLSTREFVYYSYYNRIKDKLRQYWEPKIKEKMERIMRQGRTIASSEDKITRIVILLDERGTLVRVQVISPSGVTDLDEAAVEAFRAAAPFPNPPKGIVESDGLIRIRWDFILEA